MRVVFMGTPEFGVSVLRRLVEDQWNVVAAYTQPDKPKNRGMKLIPTPVKEYALSRDIPVYQPLSCRDEETIAELRALEPDVIVVAAYGKLLPKALLEIPKTAIINVHSSILPQYRGAAPINWAILNGDEETGVTIQYMGEELDAGDILLIKRTAIDPGEDAASLYDRLAVMGGEAASEALAQLRDGTAARTPQVYGEQYMYASMLSREMSAMDFTKNAKQLVDQVRGLIPWPCATTDVAGVRWKVFRAHVGGDTNAQPGKILSADKSGIAVACGDGKTVVITELQPDGGKRMAAADYLRGRPIDL
ncbi:MAG: methionyl-tRNA formyltransferase [Oscillospiraceae bacterium]|nr:methionyl-tRNA formyltransferase [Oscillospiraceae bacterium]